MRLLLDTHVWIWAVGARDRLGEAVARALEDPSSELWLSPVSVWETGFLVERDRIGVRGPLRKWVDQALVELPLRDAPLNREVALLSREIDLGTEDPADRFLAATAFDQGLTLVTADQALLDGPVETLAAA